jgi:predicted GIY-YIG superfamily endonuclease
VAPFLILISVSARTLLSWPDLEVHMSGWWLYICEKRGRIYVGITTNLKKRLKQHGSPKLLYKEGLFEKEAAASRERQIKKWTRDKKLQLIKKSQES